MRNNQAYVTTSGRRSIAFLASAVVTLLLLAAPAAKAADLPWIYTDNGSANLDAIAWYKGNSGSAPHEVGLKQPNAFGLYDMLGNVCEYCLDRRKDGVYPFNGAASQALVEPGWQDTEHNNRGLRGGHYKQNAQFCRAAAGYAYAGISTSNDDGARYDGWGFRLWAPAVAK